MNRETLPPRRAWEAIESQEVAERAPGVVKMQTQKGSKYREIMNDEGHNCLNYGDFYPSEGSDSPRWEGG